MSNEGEFIDSYKYFDKRSLKFLSELIKISSFLKSLKINLPKLDDNEDVEYFSECVRNNSFLRYLSVELRGDNESLIYLTNILKNKTIDDMEIIFNNNTKEENDYAGKYFAEVLKDNRILKKLSTNLTRSVYEAIEFTNITELSLIFDDKDKYHLNKEIKHFCKFIQTNKTIKKLAIQESEFTEEHTMKIFESIERSLIKKIGFESFYFNHNIMRTICDGIDNCGIVSLNLSGNSLGSKSVKVLANFLKQNVYLNSLSINCCEIKDKDFIVIAKSLKDNKCLVRFSACYNQIGDSGIVEFSEFVNRNMLLKKLSFDGNNYTKDGLKMMLDVLHKNTSLEEFSFDDFVHGIESTRDVCRLIKSNKTIKKLCVGRNFIVDPVFCFALKKNRTLRKLYMPYCIFANIKEFSEALSVSFLASLSVPFSNLDDESILFISKSLQTNYTLQKIDVSYNKITDVGIEYLCELIRNNPNLDKVFPIFKIFPNVEHNYGITREKVIILYDILQKNLIKKQIFLEDMEYIYNFKSNPSLLNF